MEKVLTNLGLFFPKFLHLHLSTFLLQFQLHQIHQHIVPEVVFINLHQVHLQNLHQIIHLLIPHPFRPHLLHHPNLYHNYLFIFQASQQIAIQYLYLFIFSQFLRIDITTLFLFLIIYLLYYI